jgi:Virus neck protein
MATSVYFNNYSVGVINEQRLLEDLIVESIQIMGHDCFYIPRDSYNGDDEIYGETINARFTRAYSMEVYLANVEGYEGDGDFFSKFGLEIRDTSNFVVSTRTFEKYVPTNIATRPREGDLLYVPVMRKIFEIKFVEEELNFFSIGKRNPYMYELRCELFRFSDENFSTGVEEIDEVEADASYTIQLTLGAGSGNYLSGELVYQGSNVSTSNTKATVTDFSPTEKTITLRNIMGTFATATNLRGNTSNALYVVTSTDILGDYTFYDDYDNKEIQTEAALFIDLSEINPFGMP